LSRFNTVAIPYYAILRPDGSIAADFPGRTRAAAAFRAFLSAGV
jgi:hypothetical protein